jgi:hypothetical protein
MFSNGGLAQGGGMGEGASYDGDGDGLIPGGSIGGMAYIDEDGTINITSTVQVFDHPNRNLSTRQIEGCLFDCATYQIPASSNPPSGLAKRKVNTREK